MKPYTCLFVDWHLTLSTSVFWGQFSAPAHPQHALFALMQSRLFGPDGLNRWLLPWMRGKLTSEGVLAGVCRGTDVDLAFALQTLQDSCRQMRFVADVIPDAVAALRAKGLRVVIATDNMDTFPRWTVPSLRLRALFDDILCSFDLGALKEDVDQDGRSRFFADYLRRQHIGWGESLLLDDGGEDFGAIIRRFGIDYQHIEPGKGLVPALQALIASLS
ncbi:MAG TPA: hypothetical protein VKT82_18595 [Ktedonobacterales bacterium]|nr:hypothetical protein [Ktedonobacterales bacterium]